MNQGVHTCFSFSVLIPQKFHEFRICDLLTNASKLVEDDEVVLFK